MTTRNFKGIWIPKFIWENKNLTIMEKVFIVEIDSLDNDNGCFASNNYFADFFNCTPQRCSQIINSLVKKKFIQAKYEYNETGKKTNQCTKRVLNILNTYQEKFKRGIKESLKGYQGNVKDNNTSNNTSINNIYTYWNSCDIYKHIKLTDKIKNKISTSLKTYKENDLIKAMTNYKKVLFDEDSYFNYRWTLVDFLQRGIEKFLNDICLTNYKKKSNEKSQPIKEWDYDNE